MFLTQEERERAQGGGEVAKWVLGKADEWIAELELAAGRHTDEVTELKERVERLTAESASASTVGALTQKLEASTREKEESEAAIARLHKEVQDHKERVRAAEKLANFRKDEMDKLQEELDKALGRARENRTRASELETELEDLKRANPAAELSLAERKLEGKDREIGWYRESLEEKTTELTELRKRLTAEVGELEVQCEKQASEIASLHESMHSLEQQHKRAEANLEKEARCHNETKRLALEDQQESEKQIESLERLRSALKASLTDRENEVAQLRKQLAQVQAEAVERRENHAAALDKLTRESDAQLQALSAEHEKDLAALRAENERLQATIKQTEDRGLEILQVSRTAADLDLQSRGLSLTELYNQLATARGQQERDQEEILSLKRYLKRILADIEEQAPHVAQLRSDYNSAVDAYDNVSSTLAQTLMDCEQQREAIDKLEAKLDAAQRERDLARQDAHDLARQVQNLLWKQHERGSAQGSGMVAAPPRETEGGAAGLQLVPTSGSDTINDHLVTFDSVAELQRHNQELLASTRRLAQELEVALEGNAKAQDKAMKLEMEALEDEIKRMRESRKRQQEMVLSIVNQRDMYRVLLAQADAALLNSSNGGSDALMITDGSAASPSAGSTSRRQLSSPQRVSSALAQGGADYPALLQEANAELVRLRDEMQARGSEMQRHIDQERKIASEARAEAASAKLERTHAVQRYEELQVQLDNMRADLQREQQARGKLMDEYMNAQRVLGEKGSLLDEANAKVAQLVQEKGREESKQATFKLEVEHLRSQVEEYKKQRDAQTKVVESFQHMDETRNADLRLSAARSQQEVKRLETEVDELKAELRSNRKQAVQAELKATSKSRELAERTKAAEAASSEAKAQAERLQSQMENLRERESALREEVQALRRVANQVRELRMSQGVTAPGASDAQAENAEAGAEGKAAAAGALRQLRLQLASKSKDVEAFRAISAANEKALQELSRASEKFKAEKEAELAKLQGERDELSARLAQASKTAEDERAAIVAKANALEKRVDGSEARAAAATAEATQFRESAERAAQDIKMHKRAEEEARANYERELQLHAAAAAELKAVRGQLETSERELAKATEEARLARSGLEAAQQAWQEERDSLDKQMADSRIQLDDLARQNELLMDQVKSLHEDARKTQDQLLGSGNTAATEGGETTDETGRLRELLQILERQRNLATAEKEDLGLKVARLEAQKQRVEEDLAQSKKDFEVEMQRVRGPDAKVLSVEEHKRLLSANSENVVLRNMNAMLSAEHSSLKAKLATAQKELEDLKQESKPAESRERKLAAKVEALEGDKEALEKEIKLYRSQYEQLLGREDKVDPVEHERITEEYGKVRKELDAVTKQAAADKEEAERKQNRLKQLALEARKQLSEAKTEAEAEAKAKAKAQEEELAEVKKQLEKKDELLAKMRKALAKSRKGVEPVVAGKKRPIAATALSSSSSTSSSPPPPAAAAAANIGEETAVDKQAMLREQLRAKKRAKAAQDATGAEASASPGSPDPSSLTAEAGEKAEQGGKRKRELDPSAAAFVPPGAQSPGKSPGPADEEASKPPLKKGRTASDAAKEARRAALEAEREELRRRLALKAKQKKRATPEPVSPAPEATPGPASKAGEQGLSEEEKKSLRAKRFASKQEGTGPAAPKSPAPASAPVDDNGPEEESKEEESKQAAAAAASTEGAAKEADESSTGKAPAAQASAQSASQETAPSSLGAAGFAQPTFGGFGSSAGGAGLGGFATPTFGSSGAAAAADGDAKTIAPKPMFGQSGFAASSFGGGSGGGGGGFGAGWGSAGAGASSFGGFGGFGTTAKPDEKAKPDDDKAKPDDDKAKPDDDKAKPDDKASDGKDDEEGGEQEKGEGEGEQE